MDRTQQGEREGGTNTDCLHAGCSTYTPLQAVWSAHAQGMIRKRAMSARAGVGAVCDGDGRGFGADRYPRALFRKPRPRHLPLHRVPYGCAWTIISERWSDDPAPRRCAECAVVTPPSELRALPAGVPTTLTSTRKTRSHAACCAQVLKQSDCGITRSDAESGSMLHSRSKDGARDRPATTGPMQFYTLRLRLPVLHGPMRNHERVPILPSPLALLLPLVDPDLHLVARGL